MNKKENNDSQLQLFFQPFPWVGCAKELYNRAQLSLPGSGRNAVND